MLQVSKPGMKLTLKEIQVSYDITRFLSARAISFLGRVAEANNKDKSQILNAILLSCEEYFGDSLDMSDAECSWPGCHRIGSPYCPIHEKAVNEIAMERTSA